MAENTDIPSAMPTPTSPAERDAQVAKLRVEMNKSLERAKLPEGFTIAHEWIFNEAIDEAVADYREIERLLALKF